LCVAADEEALERHRDELLKSSDSSDPTTTGTKEMANVVVTSRLRNRKPKEAAQLEPQGELGGTQVRGLLMFMSWISYIHESYNVLRRNQSLPRKKHFGRVIALWQPMYTTCYRRAQ